MKDSFDIDSFLAKTVAYDIYSGQTAQKYPPYNIIKEDTGKALPNYVVEVAVAGFDKYQLNVSVSNGNLVIKSVDPDSNATKNAKQIDSSIFMHHGIAKRPFTLKIGLGAGFEVTDAELKNGILRIVLEDKSMMNVIEIR